MRRSSQDVMIDHGMLDGVRPSIGEIIAELEDAPERSSDVAGAIDSPFGLSELSERAYDFRGAWEPHREELIDLLGAISDRIDDVIGAYIGLDRWF